MRREIEISAQRTTALRFDIVAAQNVAEQIEALVKQYKPRVLALDMSRVSDERMLFNARAAIERYQGEDDGKEKQGK